MCARCSARINLIHVSIFLPSSPPFMSPILFLHTASQQIFPSHLSSFLFLSISFPTAYLILSDFILNTVPFGEHSILKIKFPLMMLDINMSAGLLLSCLKRVLICMDIYRRCGGTTSWNQQTGQICSSCPFGIMYFCLLITFDVLLLL